MKLKLVLEREEFRHQEPIPLRVQCLNTADADRIIPDFQTHPTALRFRLESAEGGVREVTQRGLYEGVDDFTRREAGARRVLLYPRNLRTTTHELTRLTEVAPGRYRLSCEHALGGTLIRSTPVPLQVSSPGIQAAACVGQVDYTGRPELHEAWVDEGTLLCRSQKLFEAARVARLDEVGPVDAVEVADLQGGVSLIRCDERAVVTQRGADLLVRVARGRGIAHGPHALHVDELRDPRLLSRPLGRSPRSDDDAPALELLLLGEEGGGQAVLRVLVEPASGEVRGRELWLRDAGGLGGARVLFGGNERRWLVAPSDGRAVRCWTWLEGVPVRALRPLELPPLDRADGQLSFHPGAKGGLRVGRLFRDGRRLSLHRAALGADGKLVEDPVATAELPLGDEEVSRTLVWMGATPPDVLFVRQGAHLFGLPLEAGAEPVLLGDDLAPEEVLSLVPNLPAGPILLRRGSEGLARIPFPGRYHPPHRT